jgi:hypothetical protein
VNARWNRVDTVILRYGPYERMMSAYLTFRNDPANISAWTYVVVRDTEEDVVLYMPEGTPLWRWNIDEQRLREPLITQGDHVRLLYPGRHYDVSIYYDTGSGPAPWVQSYFPGARQRFYGWKIDLASPFRRTSLGFDVIDEVLDIVVRPDRTYYWKDEDQMAELIARGTYTEQEAHEIREHGRAVIELVERAQPPFDDEWPEWEPSPDLVLDNIPDGWQLLPAVDE